MAGSGRQPAEGEEELGADVEDFEPEGGGSEGIEALLQSGSAGSVAFRGRDVGHDPPDGAVPEKISAQGRATAHRESTEETVGWELGLPTIGGGNGGSEL